MNATTINKASLPQAQIRNYQRMQNWAQGANNALKWALVPALTIPSLAMAVIQSQFPNKQAPALLQIAAKPALGSLIIDILSTIGDSLGGLSSIGNGLRVATDIAALLPRDSKHKNPVLEFLNNLNNKVISTIYLLASALIGITWGYDASERLTFNLKQEKSFIGKIRQQVNYLVNYVTHELPSKLTNPKLIKEKLTNLKRKPLETIGSGTKHGILLHSLIVFGALPFIALGWFFNKPKTELIPQETAKQNSDNILTKVGWSLAGLSRVPLIISIFASTFNQDILKRFGPSALSFSLINVIYTGLLFFASLYPSSLLVDWLRNIAGTLRSTRFRELRNN